MTDNLDSTLVTLAANVRYRIIGAKGRQQDHQRAETEQGIRELFPRLAPFFEWWEGYTGFWGEQMIEFVPEDEDAPARVRIIKSCPVCYDMLRSRCFRDEESLAFALSDGWEPTNSCRCAPHYELVTASDQRSFEIRMDEQVKEHPGFEVIGFDGKSLVALLFWPGKAGTHEIKGKSLSPAVEPETALAAWPAAFRCEHCKHWFADRANDEEGECVLMENDGYRDPVHPRTGARAEGGDSGRGHGYTRYWYGCPQFEPMEHDHEPRG